MTTTEIAELLFVSPDTLRRLTREGMADLVVRNKRRVGDVFFDAVVKDCDEGRES